MIFKILKKIKFFLSKYPKVKFFVYKLFPQYIINKLSIYVFKEKKVDYESFYIDGLEVKFSLGPLEDTRGIGRVAREQYNYLKNRYSKKTDIQKSINYYTSIHWAPETLEKNSVIMIHDVIPLILPDLFQEASNFWKTTLYNIAQQADHIITISQTSKYDISKYLNIEMKNISIVNNGVSKLEFIEDLKLDVPKNYFVYIGSYDYHKNLNVILEAMSNIDVKDLYLIMIGDNFEAKQKVKELSLEDKILFLGKLDDKHMAFVIKNAIALLFPSLYEGFGLPPMEAGLLKTPSICSNRSTMLEFLEDVSLFADPHNSKEWEIQMLKYYENKDIRDKYGKLVYEKVSKFTWEKSCENLVKILIEYKE